MSRHIRVNGKLLQLNKTYQDLKQKQKEKIAHWMYEETMAYRDRTGRFPSEDPLEEEAVIEAVCQRIEAADIWIPDDEVAERYHVKREDIIRRIEKDDMTRKHPAEKTILMNMCMVCDDGGRVLALDKVSHTYAGTTFPGGHVEPGESFYDAVVREVYEETGLQIVHPQLKGIYHWYRYDYHNIGFLYRADEFSGRLKSSEEGRVYWISREAYEKKELAAGMRQVLKIMDSDHFIECYMEQGENGLFFPKIY